MMYTLPKFESEVAARIQIENSFQFDFLQVFKSYKTCAGGHAGIGGEAIEKEDCATSMCSNRSLNIYFLTGFVYHMHSFLNSLLQRTFF